MFCLCSLEVLCQINSSLKRELDSMLVLDQRYRGYLSQLSQNQFLADILRKVFDVKD